MYTNTQVKISKYNHLQNHGNAFFSLNGHFTSTDMEQFVDKFVIPEQLHLEHVTIRKRSISHQELNNFDDSEEMTELMERGDYESSSQKRARQQFLHHNFEIKGKEYTEIYKINGYYNFDVGSDDAIYFLHQYSQSRCPEFVLSKWKKIIKVKWHQRKGFYFALFLLYYFYVGCFTLFIKFNNGLLLPILVFLSLTFIFVYDIVPVLQYSSLNTISAKNLFLIFVYAFAYLTLYLTIKREAVNPPLLKIV